MHDIIKTEVKMINETKLIGTAFKYRQKAIEKYTTQTEAIQNEVLQRLVGKAKDTEWGKEYSYSTIKDYQDFQGQVRPARFSLRSLRSLRLMLRLSSSLLS